MSEKLKIWNPAEWEEGAKRAAATHPIKKLAVLPQMPGIAEKHLKIKSLIYLLTHDERRIFRRYVFKHPLKYGLRYIASIFRKKSYTRDGDFFLYHVEDVDHFKRLLQEKDTL